MPRWFTESRRLYAVKPVLLADIGEGECLLGDERRRSGYDVQRVVTERVMANIATVTRHRRVRSHSMVRRAWRSRRGVLASV